LLLITTAVYTVFRRSEANSLPVGENLGIGESLDGVPRQEGKLSPIVSFEPFINGDLDLALKARRGGELSDFYSSVLVSDLRT
jgi:hypothetical protein